tara:strand:- start:4505 stop:5431 length:927 start_codon:yes stop_codon:yes gene_type:complete
MESNIQNNIKTQEISMRKVYLEGMLGEKFGTEWNLAVNSPAEAIAAISAQRPGFRQYLAEGENVLGYDILLGDDYIENLGELVLNDPTMHQSYTFAPIIAGSKSSGLLMVLGVALLAATGGLAFMGIPGMMGGSVTIGGSTVMVGETLTASQALSLGVAEGATLTNAMATAANLSVASVPASLAYTGASYLGMGLLLGGAAMMLAPDVPDGNNAASAENYLFSGPVNTVKQGECIPLVYGRMITGSKTVMGSLFTTSSQQKVDRGRRLVGIGGFRDDGDKHGGNAPAGTYYSDRRGRGGWRNYGGDYD